MKPRFYNDIAKVLKKWKSREKKVSINPRYCLIENWDTCKDEVYTLAHGC